MQVVSQLRVRGYFALYALLCPSHSYGAIQICTHDFAGTNIRTTRNAAQTKDGGLNSASAAMGLSHPLLSPICLQVHPLPPKNISCLPLFHPTAHPLRHPVQVSINIPSLGQDLVPLSLHTTLCWPHSQHLGPGQGTCTALGLLCLGSKRDLIPMIKPVF